MRMDDRGRSYSYRSRTSSSRREDDFSAPTDNRRTEARIARDSRTSSRSSRSSHSGNYDYGENELNSDSRISSRRRRDDMGCETRRRTPSESGRASERRRFSEGVRASERRRFSEDQHVSGRRRSSLDRRLEDRYSEQKQMRRESAVHASHQKRSSSSVRSSYGRASDYAQHADIGSLDGRAYDSRRSYGAHAYDRRDYDEYDYGDRNEYDDGLSRRGEHARHSSPDTYVRSNNNRGIFSGAHFSLPFGIGSSSGYSGGYRGNHGGASIISSLPLPVAYAIPVVVLVLIIALLIFVVSSVQSCAAGGQNDQLDVQEVQPMNLSYQASVSGIDAIADPGATVTGFTLANEGQNYTPALSEEGLNSIQTALAPFVDNGYDIGFLLMDLQTGSGYVYNPDLEVYGASSFKGPVLIYGCQESLEPGILSIDSVNDSASNAIIYSDNRSYYTMRATFEEYSEIGLVNWLANLGLDSSLESDSSFPHYSTRESAKLWMNAYLYFTSADSDPEIVSWAQDLFSQTEVSMIRAGVDPAFPLVLDSGEVYIHQTAQNDQSSDQGGDQNGENTEGNSGDQQTGQSDDQQADQSDDQNNQNEQQTDGQTDQPQNLTAADMADPSSNLIVYDKAGWLNGETDDGLCDAGIIYDGDKAYLISVMSGVPDGDDARQDLARLVAALWGQRSTLAPSQGYVLVDPAAPADQSNQTQQSQ